MKYDVIGGSGRQGLDFVEHLMILTYERGLHYLGQFQMEIPTK